MTVTLFFDDGGVLNDNNVRGKQWEKYVGEFYSSRFGGEPEVWGEANQHVNNTFDDIFRREAKEKYDDFHKFFEYFKEYIVLGMFKEVGKSPPRNININEVYNSTIEYVIPKVRSAIPGVIESIKELSARGYILYTAASIVSKEMKLYLEGMGVNQFFVEFYGPDLINTWKSGPYYFPALFSHSCVDPKKSILIDDQPQFLNNALNVGASVIQACITGEHESQFPFFVEDMGNLIQTIEDLIEFRNL